MVNMCGAPMRMMATSCRSGQREKSGGTAGQGSFWSSLRRGLKKCCHVGVGVPLIQRTSSSHHLTTLGQLVGLLEPREDFIASNRPVLLVRTEKPPRISLPRCF